MYISATLIAAEVLEGVNLEHIILCSLLHLTVLFVINQNNALVQL